jgi:hypothetical protein
VPSPYVTRARSDVPFDLDLQYSVANVLSERLVTATTPDAQPVYPTDASYLRRAVVAWLVGRFIQFDSNAYLIDSLARNYGEAAVGRLLQAIQATPDVRALAQAAGVPSVDQANLDWRDFLAWRLKTEDELITNRDEANFLNLYDTRDENVRNLAYQRFGGTPIAGEKMVLSVVQQVGADGAPALRALVQVGSGEGTTQVEVLFRLVDGVWRRAN